MYIVKYTKNGNTQIVIASDHNACNELYCHGSECVSSISRSLQGVTQEVICDHNTSPIIAGIYSRDTFIASFNLWEEEKQKLKAKLDKEMCRRLKVERGLNILVDLLRKPGGRWTKERVEADIKAALTDNQNQESI